MKRILKMSDLPKNCWISGIPNLEADLYDQPLIDSGGTVYVYTCIYIILHTILWLLIALVCLQIVKQTLCQSQYVTIFFICTTTKALLVNLEQPYHVKPRFVSNAIPAVEKLKGQKTLADIAHFESCARQPFFFMV